MKRKKVATQAAQSKVIRAKNIDEVPIDWRNVGGTHYHKDGRVIKRGEVLESVSKSELRNFLDKFVPMAKLENIEEEVTPQLQIKHKGAGRYDVINMRTGAKINDRLLSKTEALKMSGER